MQSPTTLSISIIQRLNFLAHIDIRTRKETQLMAIMA